MEKPNSSSSSPEPYLPARPAHTTSHLVPLQVLCELQMAMLERDIDIGEDVDRSIMSKEVRNTEDSSYRSLRDWYIYRDYMNGLEYVIHAFDHLKKHHH
jgi:hypothetical protein